MKIAIDASRAFLHERTGIEEYSYQLVKHLRKPLENYQVVLYIRSGTKENIDFDLPETWKVRSLWALRFWTYFRLSISMFFRRPNKLLVPGHIVPPIHPKDTVVVVHGLEYEITPEAYSKHEQRAMRRGIKNSCKWSKNIICVSNNTKKDLMRLYGVAKEKIRVVYEGVNPAPNDNVQKSIEILNKYGVRKQGYLIFIGRLEERKNITNILNAYDILRKHFGITQKLVLVGKGGFGWEKIQNEIEEHSFVDDIIITGFVPSDEKWALLRNASVFVFPTNYEGFGLPVLEAQQVGVPVVTSGNSSLKEIARDSAALVNPALASDIAEKINVLVTNDAMRSEIIDRGFKNIERFSWDKCARLTAKVLIKF
ncbi:MAG: glycosyltransferase family 4 protein [Candidatus Moraniibacteriota bacterium]|jgi:glycosyltransferase involved in cell wall biosynthesis